jgi:hypothetical protein
MSSNDLSPKNIDNVHIDYMYNPKNYSNIGKHFAMRHKTINHNNNTTIQYEEPAHEYVMLEPPWR